VEIVMTNRTFKEPLWEDPNTRQRVRAKEVNSEGTGSTGIIIDRNDTETWSILMSQFDEAFIDSETEKDIEKFRKERDGRAHFEQENQERQRQEALFAEKLVAFEIPEIKSNKNKRLKRRLRKAQTFTEIYAYAAAIIIDSDSNTDA
jgi:hypothetical protein